MRGPEGWTFINQSINQLKLVNRHGATNDEASLMVMVMGDSKKKVYYRAKECLGGKRDLRNVTLCCTFVHLAPRCFCALSRGVYKFGRPELDLSPGGIKSSLMMMVKSERVSVCTS